MGILEEKSLNSKKYVNLKTFNKVQNQQIMKQKKLFLLVIVCSFIFSNNLKAIKQNYISSGKSVKHFEVKKFYSIDDSIPKKIIYSVGIGNSYGFGLGARIQYRFGKLGVHGGVGKMFQRTTNLPFGFAAGTKFFFFRNFFINAQYGVNWIDTFTERIGTSSLLYYEAVLGPSVLIGGDVLLGESKRFGLNFGGGVGLVHLEIQPAFELGLIINL